MAFQQQHKRPQPARQLSYAASGEQIEASTSLALQHTTTGRTLDTSEEWVLFSPTAPSDIQTHTTSTDRTPRTAGLSRLSDFGSLDTAARSDQITDDVDDNATEQATDADEEAELDSLDDGLHAFHEPSDYGSPRQIMQRSGDTVLPTHDGLGTFGGASDALQTQLWQFEREAQKRKHRRRASSVQRTLEALEEVEEGNQESERFRRIERWRLEQSRALLEEIERETRRMRRLSRATSYRSQRADSVSADRQMSSGIRSPAIEQTHEPAPAPPSAAPEENEGFWQRITRRVIRDLIGIDEEILSVILGEALPEEVRESPASSIHDITKDKELETVEGAPFEGDTWQHRLLERVARELGILVHQLSEHPGAFSTYLRTAETPSYAGITHPTATATTLPRRISSASNLTAATPSAGLFAPTIPQHLANQSDPSLWGIEEAPEPEDMLARQSRSLDASTLQKEREYWERELDIKMVFQFLKRKFSSRPSSPDPAESSSVPYVGSYTSPSKRASAYEAQQSGQRAALIRQHHPLASRADNNRKSSKEKHQPVSATALQQQNLIRSRLGVRTRSDSCASQSTKRSRKSGSSRNYWDLGGSVGSGPAGLGAWGEVGPLL